MEDESFNSDASGDYGYLYIWIFIRLIYCGMDHCSLSNKRKTQNKAAVIGVDYSAALSIISHVALPCGRFYLRL